MGLAASKQEAFWEACGFGNPEIVQMYIDEGIDVNWVSYTHNSCAIHVASQGKPEIVKMLIAAKCDVNAVDERGALPMHHAAMKGFPDIMKMLVSAGSKVDMPDKNGWTPLIYAAYWCQLECVKILLKNKVMVNLDNKDDRTALHETCRSQSDNESELADIARALIEAGCELDKKSSDTGGADFTPLMYAAYYGHSGLIKALCEAKCDINLQGSNGYTALHWGVNRNNKECVAALLEHGANPLIRDKIRYRPIDRATTPDMKKLLEAAAEQWKLNHTDEESSGSEPSNSPVRRQSSSVKFNRQSSTTSNSGNVGDLVKYMLLGTDKDLEKKNQETQNTQSSITNGMNDLSVSSNHDDEIGFMDDDEIPTSNSSSPQKQVPSSSSMTSSDVNSPTDTESPILESKSEIESSEKAEKTALNGTCSSTSTPSKVLKNKNVLLDGQTGETGSEFDSEADETGFVEDLQDSDEA